MFEPTEKNIYWRNPSPLAREGQRYATVDVIVCYNHQTIEDYIQMAAILKATFPSATNDMIKGSVIIESARCKGGTIVTWNGYIDYKEYPGWSSYEGFNREYTIAG